MGDKSKELQRKIYIAEQKLRACQHRRAEAARLSASGETP